MQTLADYDPSGKSGRTLVLLLFFFSPSVKLMADEGLAKWPESFLTSMGRWAARWQERTFRRRFTGRSHTRSGPASAYHAGSRGFEARWPRQIHSPRLRGVSCFLRVA